MRLPGATSAGLAGWVFTSILTITCPFANADSLEPLFSDRDHNHDRILQELPVIDTGWAEDGALAAGYQADFPGIDRSIIGRATEDVTALVNGIPSPGTVQAGQTVNFVFTIPPGGSSSGGSDLPNVPPGSGLDRRGDLMLLSEDEIQELLEEERGHTALRKRQDGGQTVYISVNMCGPSTDQLTLYTSSSSNKPGPGQPSDQQQITSLDQGFARVDVSATGNNVFIGISAPAVSGEQFAFTVGASVDGPVQDANQTTPFSFVVDTDSTSALLTTFNLTDPTALAGNDTLRQGWLNLENSPPFSIYILDGSTPLDGIQQSYCAISQLFVKNLTVTTGISIRNSGQNPKQDFLIEGLTPGTKYQAVLAYNGTAPGHSEGSGILGGGKVYKPFTFKTKSDHNCQLIYNLPFCSDVAYAVPSNAKTNTSELIKFYDSGAEQHWRNFTISLQQVACNTTDSAKYSLVRDCNDCADAYKTWLCAAAIPRCQDLSATPLPQAYTMPRNVASNFINGSAPDLATYGLPANASQMTWLSQSRNPLIDTVVQPGPYRELLPCTDLCYELVRACPASMGFGCQGTKIMSLFNRSYGIFDIPTFNQTGSWTCNFLGVDPPATGGAAHVLLRGFAWTLALAVVHLAVAEL